MARELFKEDTARTTNWWDEMSFQNLIFQKIRFSVPMGVHNPKGNVVTFEALALPSNLLRARLTTYDTYRGTWAVVRWGWVALALASQRN